MNGRPLFVLLASLLLSIPLAHDAEPKPRKGKGQIAWEPDLTAALARASEAARPLVADFYATWCKPCKDLDKNTLADPRIVEFSKDYVWVRIDAEKDTASAHKYSVRVYPTIVVMKADGTEYDRMVGVIAPVEFQQRVEDYCAGRNTLNVLLRDEPAHANDPAFLVELADRLGAHDRIEEALARARRVFEGAYPDSSAAVQGAGILAVQFYGLAGKPSAAAATGERWLQRYPVHPFRKRMLLQMADLYIQAGERPRAAVVLRRFAEENPLDDRIPQVRMMIQSLE